MNKTILITIGVIVGLLALWLLVILFYPKTEEAVNQNVQPVVTNAVQPVGGTTGVVTATVTIVESLEDLNATNAEVTVE